MEIQRVKFLLLATALAGPACVTTVTDDNTKGDGATGNSTGGASSGTGGKGTGGATTGGSPSTGGAGGNPSTGGTLGTGGSNGGTDGSIEGMDGGKPTDGAVSIDVNRPDGNACSDDTIEGGYGNCALLHADACSIADFQVAQCNGTHESMKPFIAQLTIQCILDNAAVCDALKTYHCKDMALKLACPDATANADCQTIHTACTAVTVDDCKAYLNGMTAAGRAKMVGCMQAPASCDLYSCVEGL